MFEKYLNPDSRIYRFLSRIWNLIVVNLLTLLTCLPIFTIGASLCAMHYVLIRMHRNEEGKISRNFFDAFRTNFRKGTLYWFLFGLSFLFLWGDYRLTVSYPDIFPSVLRYVIPAIAIFLFMIMEYLFPLQARFENTVAETLRNAFILSFSKILRTIPMTVIWIIPAALLRYSLISFPLLLLLGLSLPAYIGTMLYDSTFRQLEENQEPPRDKESSEADDS